MKFEFGNSFVQSESGNSFPESYDIWLSPFAAHHRSPPTDILHYYKHIYLDILGSEAEEILYDELSYHSAYRATLEIFFDSKNASQVLPVSSLQNTAMRAAALHRQSEAA